MLTVDFRRLPVGQHDHPMVLACHRLVVRDITRRSSVTRLAERALDPLIAQSFVIYADRPPARSGPRVVHSLTVPMPPHEIWPAP
jgi:hypothetical protein